MSSLISFSQLQTKDWLGKQPKGTAECVVMPKGDSGADELSIARGQGRNGGDCLAVTSATSQQGLPGMWIAKYVSNGRGATMNASNDRGYLLPRGVKANRLSFWLRFPAGFREQSSAKAAVNFIVGTYHYDPGRLGNGPVVESNNWHFYHQLILRHDQAKGEWIHVVVNELPQHQRGVSKGFPVANPTQPAGNYWELATRIYFDCHPYMSEAEMEHPITMLVDDVAFEYVEPSHQVQIEMKLPMPVIPRGKTTRIPVLVTNSSYKPITGTIGHRSRYSWTPILVDRSTDRAIHRQQVTLAPGVTNYELMLTPKQDMKVGTAMQHGVVFVPDTEARPKNHSHADPNVQISANYGVTGPSDCSPVHAAVRAIVE
jgi:hypothetical protein